METRREIINIIIIIYIINSKLYCFDSNHSYDKTFFDSKLYKYLDKCSTSVFYNEAFNIYNIPKNISFGISRVKIYTSIYLGHEFLSYPLHTYARASGYVFQERLTDNVLTIEPL